MSDLSTLIVDLLRKKEEEQAVHAGEGELTPEQAQAILAAQSAPAQADPMAPVANAPTPSMLPPPVSSAAKAPADRRAAIEAALAAAQ